jgi:hypothetical protein
MNKLNTIQQKYKGFKIMQRKDGYPTIRVGGKERKLHVYVWEEANGAKPKGFDIHHVDLTKDNYKLENLLLVNKTDHRRIHAKWIRENGVWTKKHCSNCKKTFPLENFYLTKGKKYGDRCKPCNSKVNIAYQNLPEQHEKFKERWRRFYHAHKVLKRKKPSSIEELKEGVRE